MLERPHVRVLALDPSLACTGYAVFDGQRLVTSGTFAPIAKDRRVVLLDITHWMQQVCRSWQPEVILLEDVRGKNRGRTRLVTIIALLQVQTAVLLATACPIYAVHTSSWKAKVLGSGSAKKVSSIQFAEQQFRLYDIDDNQADACCIGYSWTIPETKINFLAGQKIA